MAESTPAEGSLGEIHEKLAHYVNTKRYIDEPEVLPWYKKDLNDLKPRTRELLEKYSNVAPEEVESHVRKVRDEAFKVYPYPCVGNWGFLNLNIAEAPAYNEVLERVKNGDHFLDIGCCMGQDIRKIVYDGVSQENIWGSDIKKDFWDIGYNLFLDKPTLKVKFIEADVFDADSGLKELDGKLNIVHATSFFHLFDWDGQVKAAKRVVELLKAEPGVIIFGRQGGKPEAGDFKHVNKDQTAYWHNPESWAKLWKQVGDMTGSSWEVHSVLGEEDLTKRMNTRIVPAGTRFMTYTIRRL